MYTRRHRSGRQIAGHELQQCHLRGRILHSHPVGLELEIRVAADVEPIVGVGEERLGGVIEMRVEDLFGECELSRFAEDFAYDLKALEEFGIGWRARFDVGLVGGGGVDCCEASSARLSEDGILFCVNRIVLGARVESLPSEQTCYYAEARPS